MREFIITDTHWDSDNIGVYCDRPDGWISKIIKNWHQIVKPEDLVIHLGDVQVGKGHNLADLMNFLPGTKILVQGNHDTRGKLWYMRNGFAFVADALAYKRVTFTHHPASNLIDGTDINIHGHVHNSIWNPTEYWQRLLAIEHVQYRPVEFEKWVNMARSEEKWKAYMKSWKVPVVKGKLQNGR